MKLACYRHNAAPRLGVYTGDGLIEIAGGLTETYPSIRAVIEKPGFAEIESWAAKSGRQVVVEKKPIPAAMRFG